MWSAPGSRPHRTADIQPLTIDIVSGFLSVAISMLQNSRIEQDSLNYSVVLFFSFLN